MGTGEFGLDRAEDSPALKVRSSRAGDAEKRPKHSGRAIDWPTDRGQMERLAGIRLGIDHDV
jgi:hypothetical protein